MELLRELPTQAWPSLDKAGDEVSIETNCFLESSPF